MYLPFRNGTWLFRPSTCHKRLTFRTTTRSTPLERGYLKRNQRSSFSSTSSHQSQPDPQSPEIPRTAIATPTTIPTEAPTPPSTTSPSTTAPRSQSQQQPFHQRLGPLTSLFNAYGRSQAQSPLQTQFWSAIVIYLLADIGAQTWGSSHDTQTATDGKFQDQDGNGDGEDGNGGDVDGKGKGAEGWRWDFARTARNLIIGGIASVPGYKWFLLLSRTFNTSSLPLSIATKVIVNQLVFTPVFNTYYFGMSALLSGASPAQILQRVRDTVPTSMWNSLYVWPWFQVVNFTFVKPEMRALSSGVFAVGWQAYLSWLNRRAEVRRRSEIEYEVES